MTTNQIEYAKYLADKRYQKKVTKENRRHNKASENEVFRHNQVVELQGGQTITEQNRHNLATEALQDKSINTQAASAKYAADTAANAQMYSANTNAAANMYAANTTAQASKYAADVQKEIAQLNADIKRITTLYSNESAEKRTEATNLSNQAVAAANNATKLTVAASEQKVANQRNEIERIKAEAEKAYKEKKIKVETFNSIVNACDTALDYINYLFPKKNRR